MSGKAPLFIGSSAAVTSGRHPHPIRSALSGQSPAMNRSGASPALGRHRRSPPEPSPCQEARFGNMKQGGTAAFCGANVLRGCFGYPGERMERLPHGAGRQVHLLSLILALRSSHGQTASSPPRPTLPTPSPKQATPIRWSRSQWTRRRDTPEMTFFPSRTSRAGP